MCPITYTFVKCSYTNYFFLNSANLICRSTDISKYFSESLGILDNESRLYIIVKRKPFVSERCKTVNKKYHYESNALERSVINYRKHFSTFFSEQK